MLKFKLALAHLKWADGTPKAWVVEPPRCQLSSNSHHQLRSERDDSITGKIRIGHQEVGCLPSVKFWQGRRANLKQMWIVGIGWDEQCFPAKASKEKRSNNSRQSLRFWRSFHILHYCKVRTSIYTISVENGFWNTPWLYRYLRWSSAWEVPIPFPYRSVLVLMSNLI